MTQLHAITVRVDDAASVAAMVSFESVRSALEDLSSSIPDSLREDLLGLFVLGGEASDLVVCEPIDLPATGASELQGLKVAPGKRYDELVAALASCGDGYGIRVVHGWPILSVGDRTPTVDRKGRGASLSPDGDL